VIDERDQNASASGQKPGQEGIEEEAVVESMAAEVSEQAMVDEVATLQKELQEARAQAAEYLDGWQRARAELANARKRFQREQEQAYVNARADVLVRLLPIIDDFDRAFRTLPESLSDLTWIDGVKLIQRKFTTLLEQQGVTPIEAVGQEFDPVLHEAITHEPSETVPAGYIIATLQEGYRVGDRVLRPSAVRVSSGPLPKPKEDTEPDQNQGSVPAD
jgi:molecular chaperone GrpE